VFEVGLVPDGRGDGLSLQETGDRLWDLSSQFSDHLSGEVRTSLSDVGSSSMKRRESDPSCKLNLSDFFLPSTPPRK
jgi:hypothetical protein